ncbi:hypothetical protein [Streptomyces sp. NBC_00568]|uniref:hypothetical protein n=1 Tax=Streptomyces sp. NBC_00568 TaxID=2975779 RepID=UPI00225B2525|nr:hypothetical protein [Streptomyces sp. NBC_00568]MCX4988459.1 hypothetical protein [Streptomyces sp. NBC_00568]
MELHEILREWCEAAEQTSEAVTLLEQQRLDEARDAYDVSNVVLRSVFQGPVVQIGGSRSYTNRATSDIDSVLQPSAPVMQRWSGAKRRQAARRSLRSLMGIYCPELLTEFDEAVSSRSRWVEEHRRTVRKGLKSGLSEGEFQAMAAEMQATLQSLRLVRQRLLSLIQQRYPLGGEPD